MPKVTQFGFESLHCTSGMTQAKTATNPQIHGFGVLPFAEN